MLPVAGGAGGRKGILIIQSLAVKAPVIDLRLVLMTFRALHELDGHLVGKLLILEIHVAVDAFETLVHGGRKDSLFHMERTRLIPTLGFDIGLAVALDTDRVLLSRGAIAQEQGDQKGETCSRRQG